MYANKIFIKLLIFSFQKNSSSSSNLQRFRQNLLEFTKILANLRLNIGEKFSTLELRGSFKNLPKVTEKQSAQRLWKLQRLAKSSQQSCKIFSANVRNFWRRIFEIRNSNRSFEVVRQWYEVRITNPLERNFGYEDQRFFLKQINWKRMVFRLRFHPLRFCSVHPYLIHICWIPLSTVAAV